MRNNNPTIFRALIRPILIGVLTGGIVCFVLLLLLSVIAVSVDVPHAAVIPLAIVPIVVGAFAGAYIAAKISKRNGWMIGLICAGLLFLISLIAGWGIFKTIDGGFIMIKLAIMSAVGLLGGIVSVNSGKHKKRS